MSALPTLYMIRRAMLDWPKMGAAIAQLAHKEFKMEKAAKKLKEFKIEKEAKKALKETGLDVSNVCKKKAKLEDKEIRHEVLRNRFEQEVSVEV